MVPVQPGARLFTPERVLLLRALYDARLTTISHLARVCGVSHKTMSQVVKRQTYADVNERPGYLHYHAGKDVLGVQIPPIEELMEQDRRTHGHSL